MTLLWRSPSLLAAPSKKAWPPWSPLVSSKVKNLKSMVWSEIYGEITFFFFFPPCVWQCTDDIQGERKIRIVKNGTLNIYVAVDVSESIEKEHVNSAKDAISKLITKVRDGCDIFNKNNAGDEATMHGESLTDLFSGEHSSTNAQNVPTRQPVTRFTRAKKRKGLVDLRQTSHANPNIDGKLAMFHLAFWNTNYSTKKKKRKKVFPTQ